MRDDAVEFARKYMARLKVCIVNRQKRMVSHALQLTNHTAGIHEMHPEKAKTMERQLKILKESQAIEKEHLTAVAYVLGIIHEPEVKRMEEIVLGDINVSGS